MRELELTVRDLAEEKASDLEKNYETVNSAQKKYFLLILFIVLLFT